MFFRKTPAFFCIRPAAAILLFLRHFLLYHSACFCAIFHLLFFIFGWKIQLARYAKINAADVPTAPPFNPPWNNPKIRFLYGIFYSLKQKDART